MLYYAVFQTEYQKYKYCSVVSAKIQAKLDSKHNCFNKL